MTKLAPFLVWPFAALSVACAVKMQVPPDVAAESDVLETRDRGAFSGSFFDESFKLGPYTVGDIDRDWNSGNGFEIAFFSHDETSSGYAYSFSRRGMKLKGKCGAKKGEDGFSLSKGLALSFQFEKLSCTCKHASRLATVFVKRGGGDLEGTLVTSGGAYQVKTIHEVEGGAQTSEPSGYRVDGEQPLGAVDVMLPGRAWLKKSLEQEEREELACLFAGLMLYVPPEEKEKGK